VHFLHHCEAFLAVFRTSVNKYNSKEFWLPPQNSSRSREAEPQSTAVLATRISLAGMVFPRHLPAIFVPRASNHRRKQFCSPSDGQLWSAATSCH